jgi:hypothetical protein
MGCGRKNKKMLPFLSSRRELRTDRAKTRVSGMRPPPVWFFITEDHSGIFGFKQENAEATQHGE